MQPSGSFEELWKNNTSIKYFPDYDYYLVQVFSISLRMPSRYKARRTLSDYRRIALATWLHKEAIHPVKKLRKNIKMGQRAFAELLGVTQSTVSKFERGELDMDIDQLINLRKKMGVDVNRFIADFIDFRK